MASLVLSSSIFLFHLFSISFFLPCFLGDFSQLYLPVLLRFYICHHVYKFQALFFSGKSLKLYPIFVSCMQCLLSLRNIGSFLLCIDSLFSRFPVCLLWALSFLLGAFLRCLVVLGSQHLLKRGTLKSYTDTDNSMVTRREQNGGVVKGPKYDAQRKI